MAVHIQNPNTLSSRGRKNLNSWTIRSCFKIKEEWKEKGEEGREGETERGRGEEVHRK